MLECFDTRGEGHTRNQRDIGRFDTTVGEIDRGWRLGRARNSDEDHVSIFEVVDMLPVVVQHGVVERIDAAEVFSVKRMLRADFVC
jgi:hypothetical protein